MGIRPSTFAVVGVVRLVVELAPDVSSELEDAVLEVRVVKLETGLPSPELELIVVTIPPEAEGVV